MKKLKPIPNNIAKELAERQLRSLREYQEKREKRKEFWSDKIWGYIGGTILVCFLLACLWGVLIAAVFYGGWKFTDTDYHIKALIQKETEGKFASKYELEEALKRMPEASLYIDGKHGSVTNGNAIWWFNNTFISNKVEMVR